MGKKKKNDFNAWAEKQPNCERWFNPVISHAAEALIMNRTGLSSGMLRNYSNSRRNKNGYL